MKQEDYRSCMAKNMGGGKLKGLSKEERTLTFCSIAKLCSGKAKDEAEARRLCSLPKEPKASKSKLEGAPEDINGIYIKVGRKTVKVSPKEFARICPCAIGG